MLKIKFNPDNLPGYGSLEDLKKCLIHRSIVEWDEDMLTLDDGTVVTIEESENVFTDQAGGRFRVVRLETVITNVKFSEVRYSMFDCDNYRAGKEEYDSKHQSSDGYCPCGCRTEEFKKEVTVTLYHNRKFIASAKVWASSDWSDGYYAIGSLVVGSSSVMNNKNSGKYYGIVDSDTRQLKTPFD